ncbi:DUF6762 family protein [Clostridium septicum]|uniref:Uncharacterized protein n=1 Tax=Clostridium septicum TaxID=1504 RepID=A0A9N7PKG2_CLOSE|nr:DUF6762 family protein [Clostridium septicum]AYE33481.1 hypothetical protein CP523_02870 [Clostridium septicum]MDU1314908.1 DUF6762 family protein [Clostridium septicum]QAS61652.1 hypothetical protein EI377_13395 [Clostridium septicum]UEC21909.1 hypothetical protein LK444_05990 [Clostridium septicum]USS00060.1 hypothetical protein NH397_11205 [Clostridium septicum]
MDFSSLVLMEKDKETGFITKELGSFEVSEGALYVKKLFVLDNIINLYFDTNKDVEEWEYSAIYDLFNYKVFEENGFTVEDVLDEYNPTFMIRFDYNEDYAVIKEKLDKCVKLIEESMEKVFKDILGKEQEYI